MADYAIGDVQGCYDPLMALLEKIHFNDKVDRLWFVGDLVNRGPQSLAVLRFIKNLPKKARITLGNHDLHLLSQLFCKQTWNSTEDTLDEILKAEDAEDIGHWLRTQSIICYDETLNVVMSHAGIAPVWDLQQAIAYAKELEKALHGEVFYDFLNHMYGNQPDFWSSHFQGHERLRVICNFFTRMRYVFSDGRVDLEYKGGPQAAPKNLYPWFLAPSRKPIEVDIVFGHWASLQGRSPSANIHAIDTGCLWGGRLTALKLQDKQRFSVPGWAKEV